MFSALAGNAVCWLLRHWQENTTAMQNSQNLTTEVLCDPVNPTRPTDVVKEQLNVQLSIFTDFLGFGKSLFKKKEGATKNIQSYVRELC